MSFTSLSFLFYFLPIALFSYTICPKSLKKAWLIIISLLFYGWMEPMNVLYLLSLILYAYLGGIFIQSGTSWKIKKLRTWINCGFLIFILLYFKYAQGFYDALLALFQQEFQVSAWLMPLGSSFILFQVLSYFIDIANDRCEKPSLIDCALYVSFFPKLLMGPIMPYHRFQRENQLCALSWDGIENGVKRFTLGLAQKVILADSFALLYSGLSHDFSTLGSWLSSFAYTFELFFDFAGYTSMAIGTAMMFGYYLNENFKHPYRALSVRDFWRRWHISLSTWFRDYVYIPLGGNRVSLLKHIGNILIVWLLTGIWHGNSFNFVIWGLYYGILILFEVYLPQRFHLPKHLARLLTFLIVNFGWVIFARSDLSEMNHQLQAMLCFGDVLVSAQSISYLYSSIGLFTLAALIVFLPVERWFQSLINRYSRSEFIIYTCLLVIAIAYLLASQYQTFMYFQF